ncbi:hypothetical protein TPA0910_11360 [Streptomyces hygroscopicus subsp. sporocinereus]|uniref:Uncharacterized protein n=1 Tax=Streptomyces hygroscopicus TaxID=1912 RepID=A0ABQ3TTN9_STRHY|nr:hypothetical protein TPA0910_11360 [Streptomyces hygroscopicus]
MFRHAAFPSPTGGPASRGSLPPVRRRLLHRRRTWNTATRTDQDIAHVNGCALLKCPWPGARSPLSAIAATTVTLGWGYAALALLTALPLSVLAVRRTPR